MPEPTEPVAEAEPEDRGEGTELEREQAAQIAALEDALADMRQQRDAWQKAKLPDREAEALSACVKALDGLTSSNVSISYGSGTAKTFDGAAIRRVLDHLAWRYGIASSDDSQQASLRELIEKLTAALERPPVGWPIYPGAPTYVPPGTAI